MKESVLMQVGQSVCNFIENGLDFALCECSFGLVCTNIHLVEIGFNKVEYEIQFVIGQNNLLEFDDVGMIDFFK